MNPTVSILIPARDCAEVISSTVESIRLEFAGQDYEIVLVPNGEEQDPSFLKTLEACQRLSGNFPEVQTLVHRGPVGKGAALKTGFKICRGDQIFFTDADLPYDLEFFDDAQKLLALGYDFVTGNRRLPESRFDVPVRLLRLVFRRHRLGLEFNRVVRFLFGLDTRDTQAGIKAMTRGFASVAFEKSEETGFAFDVEFFMVCAQQGFRHADLPVTLRLRDEKSTVKLVSEFFKLFGTLSRLFWRNRRNHYALSAKSRSFFRPTVRQVLKLYGHANRKTRLFLALRWVLTPYLSIVNHFPKTGKFLDLASGHGLFSLALAAQAPTRQVFGVDHDSRRIALAQGLKRHYRQIDFQRGDLRSDFEGLQASKFDGIAMIDSLHYFSFQEQEEMIARVKDALSRDGVFVMREVDWTENVRFRWNRLYEKIATAIGFTQSKNEKLFFRPRASWKELLEKFGFEVTVRECSSALFSDVLFIARFATASVRGHQSLSEETVSK